MLLLLLLLSRGLRFAGSFTAPVATTNIRLDAEVTRLHASDDDLYEINNSSIIPLIEAVQRQSTNRYVSVIQIARKARQRAELQLLTPGGGDDSVKPLIAQFQQEYANYQNDLRLKEKNNATIDAASLEVAEELNFREDPGTQG